MTSPVAPHPKQVKRPGTASTDIEGVVSSWKGQRAM